jgi:hypothetical protein
MTTFTLRYIEGAFLVTSKDIEARKSESRREAKDWCASHTRNFGFSGKLPGDGNSAPRWAYFDGSGEAALEKRMIRWPAFQSSASLPSLMRWASDFAAVDGHQRQSRLPRRRIRIDRAHVRLRTSRCLGQGHRRARPSADRDALPAYGQFRPRQFCGASNSCRPADRRIQRARQQFVSC